MPDYEKLFYESQAHLADIADELKRVVLKIQKDMRETEEKVISDESNS